MDEVDNGVRIDMGFKLRLQLASAQLRPSERGRDVETGWVHVSMHSDAECVVSGECNAVYCTSTGIHSWAYTRLMKHDGERSKSRKASLFRKCILV